MVDFTFTASAECDRCGKLLSSSDEECDNCADYTLSRYHFVKIGDEREVEVVWAINAIRAWAALGKRFDWERDRILPWRLYETDAMSLHYAQRGYDVTDEEALRQPNL